MSNGTGVADALRGPVVRGLVALVVGVVLAATVPGPVVAALVAVVYSPLELLALTAGVTALAFCAGAAAAYLALGRLAGEGK